MVAGILGMGMALGGCVSNAVRPPIAAAPQTTAKMQADIKAIKANPGLSDNDKELAIRRIRGEKEATEQAKNREIMTAPNTSPEEKKSELEIYLNNKDQN